MTEEMGNLEMPRDKEIEIPDEISSAEEAMAAVEETMASLLDVASVDRVYGAPVRHGDTVVIPTAELLAVGGFGVGYGYGSGPARQEGNSEAASTGESHGGGAGGGGGGRVFARPVAVIAVSPEGNVRIEPVADATKIALAAITAGGFMIATLLSLFKYKK